MTPAELELKKHYFRHKYLNLTSNFCIVGWASTMLLSLIIWAVLGNGDLGLRVMIGSFVFFIGYLLNYFGLSNTSRFVISLMVPVAIFIVSIMTKSQQDYTYYSHPEAYYEARNVLWAGLIFPILSIGVYEKRLLIFSVLPSVMGVLLFDFFHNLYGLGPVYSNNVIVHYFSGNLYTIVSLVFVLISVFYFKNKSEKSEYDQHLRNHKSAQILSSLAKFANSPNLLSGNIDKVLTESCKLIWECTDVEKVGVWIFNKDESDFKNKVNFVSGNYFENDSVISKKTHPEFYKYITSEISSISAYTGNRNINLDITFFGLDFSRLLCLPYFGEYEGIKGFLVCENKFAESDEWNTIFIHSVTQLIQKAHIFNMLETQQSEITQLNQGLEKQVKVKTKELTDKNRKLINFSFMNSHLLRAPVARIQGLLKLSKLSDDHEEKIKINQMLEQTAEDLDRITRKIGRAIEFEDFTLLDEE